MLERSHLLLLNLCDRVSLQPLHRERAHTLHRSLIHTHETHSRWMRVPFFRLSTKSLGRLTITSPFKIRHNTYKMSLYNVATVVMHMVLINLTPLVKRIPIKIPECFRKDYFIYLPTIKLKRGSTLDNTSSIYQHLHDNLRKPYRVELGLRDIGLGL